MQEEGLLKGDSCLVPGSRQGRCSPNRNAVILVQTSLGCQQVMEVSLGEACAELLPRSPGKSLQSRRGC